MLLFRRLGMSLVFTIENKKNLLLGVLFIKALILAGIIVWGSLDLSPDEAQYWTWSQELAPGYYSKPPGIAWQIALTSFLFGSSAWGVRCGSLVIGFLIPYLLFRKSLCIGLTQKISFWAALLLATSPLGFFVSFAATTDGGSILFFMLAILFAAEGMVKKKISWPIIGLLIGCGALYKWVAFVAWVFILPLLYIYPQKKKGWLKGVLISLVALIPVLYWNFSHEWATFRHVGETIFTKSSTRGNIGDFLLANVGIVFPPFFYYCMRGGLKAFREKSAPFFFLATLFGGIGVYLMLSLFKKIQINWVFYFYPPLMILGAWWALSTFKKGEKHLKIGGILSSFLVIGGLLFFTLQPKSWFPLPYRMNPFQQNLGWSRLPSILLSVGYNPEKEFLFSNKYQGASLLSFYAPLQKRAYFFNISENRKNQFSYWPGMAKKEKGNAGFFVVFEKASFQDLSWYRHHYLEKLHPYFEHVEFIGAYSLYESKGSPVKYAIIFKGLNYNGLEPMQSSKY